jgi:DHA1 family tetracycline resistance protein-like MFS transporter
MIETRPATEMPPAAPARRTPAFVFVFITVLLDMLALGMIIPVLPKLVADFSAAIADRSGSAFRNGSGDIFFAGL